MFTNILDVKKNCSKRKTIKYGNTPWAMKKKREGDLKSNEHINKSLYKWIVHHPQVVESPIVNDCLKVKTDGHTEPQLVPKLLLCVSII